VSKQISLENISKSFSTDNRFVEVLKNITYSFEQNKSYAISGVSGSGKSTLMHIIAGLEPQSKGAVYFDGVNIESFSKKQKQNFLRFSVGLVFQEPFLINELSVLENVIVKGLIVGQTLSECKKRGCELLEKVGLKDKIDSRPHVLSGGQRQRVAVARALFNPVDFLLADEPTGSLDQQTGSELVEFICSCKQDCGVGLIVTSHDEMVASAMDCVLELKSGKLEQRIF
jgi:lipoprotein-releasing system ATP-binding protein